MKLYRAMVYDSGEGRVLAWFANKREADRWVKAEREQPQGPCGVDPVEIPTDRAGLLAWLNAHMTRDNG